DAPLGVVLDKGGALAQGLRVREVERRSQDRTDTVLPGKTSSLRDHFHEMTVQLEESAGAGRRLDLIFRAYNDGVAFRYRFPSQDALPRLTITEEQTGFAIPGNPKAYALPLGSFTT